ncbi:MAG: type II toxin-antitoxin system Phd/YefM family antitoxin [Aridibacter sp.]
MTKTINLNEDVSIRTAIALTVNGDEVIIEDNGEPIAKLTSFEKPKEIKKRTAGLGKGTMWMSEDFDDELSDEFWGFDKEL